MPFKPPSVSQKSPQELASLLRQELADAVRYGRVNDISRLCLQNDCDVVLEALSNPESLYNVLDKELSRNGQPLSPNQRLALEDLSSEQTATTARQRNERADNQPLVRAQKKSIGVALAEWLTGDELRDEALTEQCRAKLTTYRSRNPKNLIDRQSFPEILAAAERDGNTYRDALNALATEWKTSDGTTFTPKRFAAFVMSNLGRDCGVTADEVEHWLNTPGYQPRFREKVTEAVCFALGMTQADEARLWRLACGKHEIEIPLNQSALETYDAVRAKLGMPSSRVLNGTNIRSDIRDMLENHPDLERPISMLQALELLELANPSKHWLTDNQDKTVFDRNWNAAQAIHKAKYPGTFEDVLLQATKSEKPYATLTAAIIGKQGIHPISSEELTHLWSKALPNEDYTATKVLFVRSQGMEKVRTLFLAEAQVIVDLAKKAYPFMSKQEEEASLEILTRSPSARKLMDQYLKQVDDTGAPAKIKLKETLERIAAIDGQSLKTRGTGARPFIPELGEASSINRLLRMEDRLASRSAPVFADRMSLEGEQRRQFLVKSQGFDLVEPLDIVERILRKEIKPNEGARMLLEQTGMNNSQFARHYKYTLSVVQGFCNCGVTTDPKLCTDIAAAVGRPSIASTLQQIFCYDKRKGEPDLNELNNERTDFHRSRVAAQATRAGLNNEKSR